MRNIYRHGLFRYDSRESLRWTGICPPRPKVGVFIIITPMQKTDSKLHSGWRMWPAWLAIAVLVLALCMVAYALFDGGRPTPVPVKHTYYDGAVTYHRHASLDQ